MAGLSFEKKRAPRTVGYPAAVPVRVYGPGNASVDGVAVAAAPGEEIQQAVLNRLQSLAISVGAPIHATVHDDLAGCVVPLEVSADGSSRVTGEPVRLTAPRTPDTAVAAPTGPGAPQASAGPSGPPPAPDARTVTAGTRDAGTGMGAGVSTASGTGTSTGTASGTGASAGTALGLGLPYDEPAPAQTPAHGFDAVAEEVLGDGPLTETAEGAELLAEPLGRINEAVRAGRVDAAAELAERTLAEASAVFGPHHAEVLHVRELSAYIAYLADDPVRACRLSLELAGLRRQAGDGQAAYGNLQSAATAWRAVRDPEEGLRLGRDLIGLWTDLGAEPGPAADDPRPLEAARARMIRLTDRAAKAAQG
ncbi:hypothetical protein QWJ26_00450 [Streptomyces sp. CSDS2]|uniref:hypothetical protein n=1 Tax=Streptomyces sp. CSDS2 TaxID=3055051 RepID=UPI0025AF7A85|nr:hypothetical protein [Streptomyces sp. CSDS2]MDN3258305.1 hypothetical protein [Streptomyces sp. CSDS2]